MSGYRSFHRESLGSFPIWQVASSPVLRTGSSNLAASQAGTAWRVWVACGDGVVRGYLVVEKTLETQKDALDAANCKCVLTHVLLGSSQEHPGTSTDSEEGVQKMTAIGCSQVQVARNYVGEDDAAGDLIVVSSDLSGKIRIWVLPEDMDNGLSQIEDGSSDGAEVSPEVSQEFWVENATGTCIKIMPPNVSGVGDILLAVPCLDGTVALVATGLTTPKSQSDSTTAGVVVDRWSKAATSIALSGAWHPLKKSFVVGRQDGLIEIFGERSHRLIQHEAPVRGVAYTPDGNLMITSSDDGMICMWDTSRSSPVLVQHVVQAHATWVLGLASLSDSRRFISCGADRQIHVWSAGQMDQAQHSFTSDDVVWTIDSLTTAGKNTASFSQTQSRLISGSEKGGLHIYTLES
ncbi:unnamed protein product [Pseudo-nitzschia multistriata]|uniref:Uncharacterized protein n=1 Tax=Pseudo-nitzschia multistriata TaxID=183589 RepID=A0A448YUT2_9STRA|nr:unnamed protein product [Pseudo-nitzschia multistriata]